MKTILASIALVAAAPIAQAASLELTVTQVEDAAGTLLVAVFDSETGWQASDAVASATAPVTGEGAVTLTIDGLPEGEVGIKLYQDVDNDGELARSAIGIPKEPYGFSNDAPVRFGPPKWDAAKFSLAEDANSHVIALR